jgi:hypothetical protein
MTFPFRRVGTSFQRSLKILRTRLARTVARATEVFKEITEQALGSKSCGLSVWRSGMAACWIAASLLTMYSGALWAVDATGPEFLVNTFTTNSQINASVARNAGGDFVVAWQSPGQDGSGDGIYAQRYNKTGVAQGAEFQVNTTTSGSQINAAVAMDSGGNFVVAWQDPNGVIAAQRFNAAGVAQGAEIQVNTSGGGPRLPSVAMDTDGDFVVVWDTSNQDGSMAGTFGQRFNAAGVPQGSEFQVNTFTAGNQGIPSVAMDANGNFVVTWISDLQDGDNFGCYAQRYNAAGVPQGAEFRANTVTTGIQSYPVVAMDADGDFVIAWENDQEGSGNGVYAQRYNAAGVQQGAEFRVNTFTNGNQYRPSVAMDAAGDFIVTWLDDNQDGSSSGIFAQSYNASGVPQGSEFRVNTFTTGSQQFPSVAMDAAGNFIVAWQSIQDGSGFGIYAQLYGRSNTPPSDIAISNASVAENSAVNSAVGNFSSTDLDPNDTFAYALVTGTGDTDNASFQIVGNELRTLAVFDFETKSSYSIRVKSTDAGGLTFEKAFTITVTNLVEALSIGSLNASTSSATTGQTIVFTATATSADGGTLTYEWTFSDGTTAIGESVTKAFLAEGTYTAFVTVSNGKGGVTISNTLTLVVSKPEVGNGIDSDGDGISDSFEEAAGTSNSAATARQPHDFAALNVRLRFRTSGKDSIDLRGVLPTTTQDFTGKTAAVDIGGVVALVALDAKGHSAKGDQPIFSIKPIRTTGQAKLRVFFKKGAFNTQFENEGLTNELTPAEGKVVTVPVIVGFEGAMHSGDVKMTYRFFKGSKLASAVKSK